VLYKVVKIVYDDVDDILTKKKIETNTGYFHKIALGLLIFANIFDMGGAIGIKYISFLLIIPLCFYCLQKFKIKHTILLLGLFVFIFWPIFSVLVGLINNGDISLALSQITPFFCGLIFFIVLTEINNKKYPLRLIYNGLIVLSVITILAFFLLELCPELKTTSIFNILFPHPQNGYFGFRPFGNIRVPNIYFRATLFMVPAFIYFLFNREFIKSIILFTGLLVSFSKAGILIALLFLIIFIAWNHSIQKYKKCLFFLLIILLLSILNYTIPLFGNEIINVISGKHETIAIRSEHLKSVIALFENHPSYFIIGQGTGTQFFSTAVNREISNIEIDHVNAIRKFGLIWFLIICSIIYYISYRLITNKDRELKAVGFALIGLFLAVGTNPVFINPLFFMILFASYFILEGDSS
jgi:hypothetical protein